jgi:hypothetical protein
MHIKPPFRRKSTLQRFVDSVGDQVGDAASHVTPDLHAMKPGKAVRTGLITAAGLTAGSAAISSLRQRMEQERGDS